MAVGLVSAACSSGGSGASSPPSAAPAAGSPTASAGVAAATAYLQTVTANPTTLPFNTPLTKPAPKGKFIIALTSTAGVNGVVTAGNAAAAAALGWTFKTIAPGPGAGDLQKAFETALQQKPDGIIVSGSPKSTYSQALAAAKAAGIPVVSDSTTDPGGTGDGIISNPDGPPQVHEWGKMIGAAIVKDTGGKAHVLSVSLPEFPILNSFTDGLKAALTEWCPDCVVTDLNAQASDIGSLGAAVVSAVQKDPSITYVTFSFGDLSGGVPAALTAAGLQVKIAGETATPANIQAVKDGTETAWTGFAAPILGWYDINAFVQFFTDGDAVAAGKTFLPTQVITKDNAAGLVLDPNGYYIGVADYEAQFKKLWLLN